MMFRFGFLILFILQPFAFHPSVSSNYPVDSIQGYWSSEGNKAKIQIWRSGQKFFGKIIALKEPFETNGKPKLDDKNPDEKRRSKPIVGLVILKDFVYDPEENDYENGTIYDPESGNTYSSYMEFQENPNILKVRGYIGFSIIGRSQIWTRTQK
jgi:uncharacterized protein (DUF2147 family)